MKSSYKYIEIVHMESGKVENRIEVTGHSQREIEKIEDGVNINLHDDYMTRIAEYTTEQKEQP